jgi:hypothetical protein
MLTPVGGYLGGGGSSGGGGGGGGGSTVSDAEFAGAIAQDTANRQSGGGGVSYGNSGYVGSGGSSADVGGQPAPTTYTANDGSIHTSIAARDAKNAEIAEAARQAQIASDTLQANTSFNATYDQLLNQIAGTKGYYTSDDVAYAYKQAIENTDNSKYVTSTTASLFEGINKDFGGSVYNDDWLDDTVDQFIRGVDDWSTEAEKDMPSVTSKSDDSFTWSGLFDSVKSAVGIDTTPEGVETISIDPVNEEALQELGGAMPSAAPTADISVVNGVTYVDAPYQREGTLKGFEDGLTVDYGEQISLDEGAMGTLYEAASEAGDYYGTGVRSEIAFTQDLLNAHQAAQENSSETLSRTDRRLVINPETGRIQVDEGVSVANLVASGVDYLANKGINYGIGYAAGMAAFAVTGVPVFALGTAMTTETLLGAAGVADKAIVDHKVSVDGDGTRWVEQRIGGETTFTKLEDMFSNSAANAEQAQQSFESGDFDVSTSLSQGIGLGGEAINAKQEAATTSAPSKPSWSDIADKYYNLDFSLDEAIAEITTGVGASAETVKAIEFTTKVANGEDFVEAAVSTYADKVMDIVPEGYEQPTEAAIRIGLGEDRVSVLGDVYGQDLGLDNPLGKASVESLNTYDQTGDTNKALVDGIVTYVEEGGELPDFEAPDYIVNELDFDLPDIDFGGVNFADLPDINLPDMIDLDLNIGSIDFSGVPVPDLNIDLGELPDLAMDIDLPSLDWSGVDVTLPEVNLPELNGLGVDIGSLDWSGTNIGDLPDIDLSGLDMGDLEGLAKGTTSFGSLEPDADLMGRDLFQINLEDKDTPLSRKILNAKLV